MANEIVRNIQFPELPTEGDPAILAYLLELERVLVTHLSGDVFVPGNLSVGGEIHSPNMPAADPSVVGQLFHTAGDIKIST